MNAATLLSVLPLLVSIGGGSDAPPLAAVPAPAATARQHDEGEVRVWLADSDDLLRRGDRARVSFRADERGYVTIVRIDTDGGLHVLFPDSPHDDGYVSEGRTYHAYPFHVDDDHGVGYVFAVWSPDPFDYYRLRDRGRWGYRLASWRVRGDPYVAADDFARQIVERRDSYYSIDMDEYSVGRRYAYPRFMCYDCHAGRPYHRWDPYAHRCVSVRVIVYDDPYYYPYRRYRGTRVVYARPRYEFKEVGRGERVTPENYIERRRRVASADPRRPGGDEPDPRPRPGGSRPDDDAPRPGGGGGNGGGGNGDGPRPGGTIPPGHGGTPPGQGGTPPGQGNDPPSQGGTPPGHQGTPPGQGGTPPGRRDEVRREPRGETRDDRPARENARPERRDEPRAERSGPPRVDERRAEPRREEPRREEPRREESRREQPRREEPRREEPRREEPRRERAEPERRPERPPPTRAASSREGARSTSAERPVARRP
jgi:hypothetical protein